MTDRPVETAGGAVRDRAKLLPCAHCGGSDVRVLLPTCRPETPYNPGDRLFPIVRCKCGVEVPGFDEDYEGTSAIRLWNHRVDTPDSKPSAEASGDRTGLEPATSAFYSATPSSGAIAADSRLSPSDVSGGALPSELPATDKQYSTGEPSDAARRKPDAIAHDEWIELRGDLLRRVLKAARESTYVGDMKPIKLVRLACAVASQLAREPEFVALLPAESRSQVDSEPSREVEECDEGCSMCSGEYCAQHFNDPCDCDVADRHTDSDGAVFFWSSESESAIEPSRDTDGLRKAIEGVLMREYGDHAGEVRVPIIAKEIAALSTPTPATQERT